MAQDYSPDTFNKLLQQSMRWLSVRARSELEIRQYLNKKASFLDESKQVVEDIIQQIKQFNLLNDEVFAREWTRVKLAKGKGLNYIKQQLKLKGISSNIIAAVMAEIEPDSIKAQALKVLTKKATTLSEAHPFKRSQKLKSFLYSRGYSLEIINQLVDDRGQIRVE